MTSLMKSTIMKQLKLSGKESRNILTQQRELPKHDLSFIFSKIYFTTLHAITISK